MDYKLADLIHEAKQGNLKAMLSVAKHYMQQEDYIKAHEYLLMAAEKGNAFAEHKVGINYCYGMGGVEQNLSLGVKYLQSAADKNNTHAEFALAMAIDGNEEAKTYLRKNSPPNVYLFYLEKAAKHGHAYAQLLLGNMNIEGKEIPYNLEQGIFWWGCAFLHDEEGVEDAKREASDKLDLLRDIVPSSEIDDILNFIKENCSSYTYHNYE